MSGELLVAYMEIISILLSIIISLFFIFALTKRIGLWGIFSKAGEKEWKAMVPIYNQITLLKICKLSPWFVILYLDYLIPLIGFILGRDVTWAFIIVSVGFICYRFLISIRLGDAYKKGDAFPFFMAIFPSILYPVLGCSKNEKFAEIKIKKVKNKETKDSEANG